MELHELMAVRAETVLFPGNVYKMPHRRIRIRMHSMHDQHFFNQEYGFVLLGTVIATDMARMCKMNSITYWDSSHCHQLHPHPQGWEVKWDPRLHILLPKVCKYIERI